MAMSLAPVLKRQFFDANGNPLAGGKVYTYQSGTVTPQNTYTDSGGLTANANPIILDANGEADIWLDPSLSYKFIVTSSADAVLSTEDGIIGLLTNDSVSTAALQALSVTTAKIANDAVTADKLADHASTDASRAVTTNHIRDAAITAAKLADSIITRAKLNTPFFVMPAIQQYTTGSGTHNRGYAFMITSGSATVGATYTHNAVTYTVLYTIASGTLLHASGSAAPAASGTLTKTGGTGDTTITYSAVYLPTHAKVRLVGGGGGGGGGSSSGTNGGAGGNTTFGTSLLTANGGGLGVGGSGTPTGGAGGTATIGTGAYGLALTGANGCAAGALQNEGGCTGGVSFFGGAGGGGLSQSAGVAAAANSGSGGGSGGGGATTQAGGSGGAGGYIEAIIPSPGATYSYAIGAAGAAGGGPYVGGAGGSGLIIVEEHFQ